MSGDIVFEEPPPTRTPRSLRLNVRLDPLRSRPGEWARVFGPSKHRSNTYQFASRLRAGEPPGITPGEFEARTGRIDQSWYVWARYVGNGHEAES